MEFSALLAALSDPAAYPRPAPVEVRQTHLSAAFLVGDTVYKVRKPVNLGFVDFTTLDQRKRDCDEEVRLNRRLAPSVYRGVVPITVEGGRVTVGGPGGPVEWAVEMVRLPDEAMLKSWLDRDELTAEHVAMIARRIADFHRTAERRVHVSRYGRFDVVAGNARENFAQTAGHVGLTVRRPVYERCRELTERALANSKDAIESRAARGVPCDTHGDLHLSHVYLFPDRPPPADLVIIDCVEFAERFRFADPVADIAFLVMDLAYHGRADLARTCADAYFAAEHAPSLAPSPPASGGEGWGEGGSAGRTGLQPPGPAGLTPLTPGPSPPEAGGEGRKQNEGRRLLPFYIAYRAVVRAKVKGMGAQESEVAEVQRAHMRAEAQAHWLFALGTLQEPTKRPGLVLVGGLPGTGKSTLARGLAAAANFTVIRSDEVRKELAGVPKHERADGFYTAEWTERVYDECLKRAGEILSDGGRAIVDASFASDQHRRTFLTAARQLGVSAVLLICRVPEDLVRERLRLRRGDVSDAGWEVFEGMRDRWDELSSETRRRAVEIDTTQADRAMALGIGVLHEMELA